MGELTPGTPLRLEDLARQLGMSISPIREAVRQLEALGLAEHVPHHGAKVMAPRRRGAARALRRPARAREAWRCAAPPSSSEPEDADAARAQLDAYDEARHRGDIRAAVRAHGVVPLRAVRGGAVVVAPAADPPGVGLVRALPAGAARGGHAAGPARGARRRAARRVHGARCGAGGRRCTTISSSRRTSTRSSSRAARSSRSRGDAGGSLYQRSAERGLRAMPAQELRGDLDSVAQETPHGVRRQTRSPSTLGYERTSPYA